MIRCYSVPLARAIRRAVAPRPRPTLGAVPGTVIRRAPRRAMTVCRDAGLGALLLATAGAAPLPEATSLAAAAIAAGPDAAAERHAAATGGIAPLWSGSWGGFPAPADPSRGTGLVPGPAGEMPVPLLTGDAEAGNRAAVPEPSSLALLAAGLLAAFLLRRRYGV